MNSRKQPAFFISHGSPMLALETSETTEFLKGFGQTVARPNAIVVFSAHLDTQSTITITSAENPKLIYDFYGFPSALYDIHYPASGAPQLASKIQGLISKVGLSAELDGQLGWDHGVWMPLYLMYPKADIPIVQVSISTELGANVNYQLGEALASLRTEGVMLIGSGGISHNLPEISSTNPTPNRKEMVSEFTLWIADKLQQGDHQALLNYLDEAPHALFNHPTQEHFVPLLPILGASSSDNVTQIHRAVQRELLAMDAYQFG
ncbi:class III extradiol ring-cleavage dioxygenase [Vibrio sp. 10N.261.55.A7]|uniref:DODA-type extradiol aromatic ring-opening family dioxygenase n=1 Tax=Vibrio sp. 10N.261.55.A7 TaxID=1880851 RepID=UPI000C850C35|nr:class III extradiol ring-cleavage dioxygenase [Vibrio sp. 10N.261.55.A7]PMJ91737.1 dioxygenase [Vibrio sp. 10N.261.55.A7]